MKKASLPVQAYKNPEFLLSTEARTVRILSEYYEPLARLSRQKVNSTILFFGSSRANPKDKSSPLHRYYWEAEDLAYRLARWAIRLKPKGKNFVICTGGGPGIMEAANRGASRAGGISIGMNISIPLEQRPNPYITPDLSFLFHYFFMRKFWLIYRAKAIVAFPGGFGTLDEVFEVLTLIQTQKMPKTKLHILLYGEEYWRNVVHFEKLIEFGTIDPGDLDLFSFASRPKKAFDSLRCKLIKCL